LNIVVATCQAESGFVNHFVSALGHGNHCSGTADLAEAGAAAEKGI
jgi:hypothetical protein